MGASACMELARRGKRVLGIERFRVGHDGGSTHGGSRIIRDCYFEHPNYVPLLLECREGWDRLEHDSGRRIVHRPGVLYAGGPGSEVVEKSLESGATHGIRCERWSATEAMKHFPQFRFPTDWCAMFEPGAGFARPERAVRAACAIARSLGADVHEGERVLRWEEFSGGVRVVTSQSTYEAGSLILTAGAWMPALAQSLGVALQPQRVVVAWLQPVVKSSCESPRMPVWYLDRPGTSGVYGVPMADDQEPPLGVKVSTHGDGTPCDPEAVRVTATESELENIRKIAASFVSCCAERVVAGATCLYTMTPDQHFVVDRMPGSKHVTVACGFSGHGFKFMPVMGRILADMACDGRTTLPVGFLGLGRFSTHA